MESLHCRLQVFCDAAQKRESDRTKKVGVTPSVGEGGKSVKELKEKDVFFSQLPGPPRESPRREVVGSSGTKRVVVNEKGQKPTFEGTKKRRIWNECIGPLSK